MRRSVAARQNSIAFRSNPSLLQVRQAIDRHKADTHELPADKNGLQAQTVKLETRAHRSHDSSEITASSRSAHASRIFTRPRPVLFPPGRTDSFKLETLSCMQI
jgi:hypothetical protein